jgi:uncharacterized membrane protein YgcG
MNDRIVPNFRKRKYSAGIRKGVQALVSEFAYLRVGGNLNFLFFFLALMVIIPISASLLVQGKKGFGWICLRIFSALVMSLVTILLWLLQQSRHRHYHHHRHRHRYGWGGVFSGGGLGGSGGSGGGFSGGGGGATGSW